ncbi:hypothetical protein [Cecembia rubra]|uniref:Uncharacterized protein n=1 Tax=Cecembia rubra TaxID=1485585 RepID=A0A2P8DXP9_9BACT|nr:hypothetical protein [Cecembia rubra]PSL02001.1 hypothetical protein CLV48_11190 [Cecembia rubra]
MTVGSNSIIVVPKTLFFAIFILGTPLFSVAQIFNKQAPLVDLKEIKEITVFYPGSRIEVVGKGMGQVHHDSASTISAQVNADLIMERLHLFEKAHFYPLEEISHMELYSLDLMELAEKASKNAPYVELRVTPTIFSMLSKTDTPYSMLIYHDGFVRKKGNMTGEMFKSIGIGVATLGNYAPIPVSNSSNIFIFIIDKELGHAVFAKKYEGDEIHPLKKKKVAKQYKFLLKDFY